MSSKSPRQLYHFTCSHGFEAIGASGILRPNVHPLMAHLGPLLWLTDLAEPSRDSVGLTSDYLTCDRMAYRYSVHTRAALGWADLRERVSPAVVKIMESYSDPAHWWVVRRPLTPSEFALDRAPHIAVEVTA